MTTIQPAFKATGSNVLLGKRDEANKTINLSTTYDSDVNKAVFDPRSSERLFTLSKEGELRAINTSNETLSPIIAENVSSVSAYRDDAMLYVQSIKQNEKSVSYFTLSTSKTRELKRIQTASQVFVAVDSFFSDPYVAISTGTLLDIYQLNHLPGSDSEDAISMTLINSQELPALPSHLSIGTSGRFVIAQYKQGVAIYDLELSKSTLTALNTKLSGQLRWLDRYHFYVLNQKYLSFMEFDGANQHRIADVTTNFDAVQTDDGKYIYSITKSKDGFSLQRSQMILS